jgi:dihydroorotate dehydrogenase electron transfer subunit
MQTAESLARRHETMVLARREPAAGVVVTEVRAPALAASARPGQFVMVVPPGSDAASIALGVYDTSGDTASLLFFVAGARTRALASVKPGETLTLLGPLGNGFFLNDAPRDVAIVAGGVGIASVLLAARALAGARVRLFYGARTAQMLVECEPFARAGCDIVVTTDDGSAGERGFITDALARAQPPQLILACGPTPMLRATARIAATMNVPAQLALEETFACGVGGCWGCVVPIAQSSAQAPPFPPTQQGTVHARICCEGPVFWAHELRW